MSQRSDFLMDVTFSNNGKQGTDSVYIPITLLTQSLVSFAKNYYDTKIEGDDRNIWNLFNPYMEELLDNERFVDILKEEYLNSRFYEEDYNEWLEDQVD